MPNRGSNAIGAWAWAWAMTKRSYETKTRLVFRVLIAQPNRDPTADDLGWKTMAVARTGWSFRPTVFSIPKPTVSPFTVTTMGIALRMLAAHPAMRGIE
jgi:hypothetical protein